ncbi:TonB-dependent receptor [Flavobacterium cucumis]|uniref:TonB-linked outer membrane protein, SusC/RagA family n=1 Tax=Flavobacterium cucumis TaxID=416016 RepID=A0A1M7ZWU2_9FLAO|nr:TonB-dependent receptor [Flavobacterium cucumis]SHO73355.1 TonB-linked outer membrane protein, SusC/RagA family [Flavobacterium cucumis]
MKSKILGLLTLFIVLFGQMIFAQTMTVSGTVSDSNGEPIIGAAVQVKGTKNGVQTDFNGKYVIKANNSEVLIFSYLGMKTQEILITSNNINVKMLDDAAQLAEVVVVGYGVQKRSEVTGSISKIQAKDIQNLVTPSFDSQLAGRASGVQVTTSNGIIGEAPRIRIRGIASIGSGTYPLIIVDGMPIYTGDLGGQASNNALGDINPSDIESFEILKDGAATAIYGSRAANGVIIITTKKGKKGSLEVNYNNTIGFASAIKTFDLLKTSDFLTIANEKRTNRSQAPWAIGNTYDTDWQDAVLNNSAAQIDHNLSFNGGSDNTRYYLSFGYTEQDGVAKSNSMDRYTLRTNLEHDVNKWMKIGGNVALTRTSYSGLNTGRSSLSGNMFNAIRQLPNTPIYNPNHPTGYNLAGGTNNNSFVGQWDNTDPVGDNISNIVYVLDNNRFKSEVNRTLINTFASAKISESVNYRMQIAVDKASTNGFLYWNPIHGDGEGFRGYIQNDNTDLTRWNWQHIINYNKTFFEKHNVTITAVAEYQKETNKSFFGRGKGLLDSFYNQNLVTGSYETQESGGSVTESGIMSYIGRLNYNFEEKYFFQASIRRDGISKLSPETRWNNFTGFSAGWNIAKESFFSNLNKHINELKLRGSYSEVGNTDIGSYPYLGLTSASPYASSNGIAFTQFGNDALLWETSSKTDFGIDLAFFNNRLSITADYYNNDIDGLILQVPVAPTLGIPSNIIRQNIGSMYNRGYEFNVNLNAIDKEKFSWNINANLTLDKNKVTSLPNGQDILGGTFTDVNIAPNLIIREGESLNSIYGIKYWGVNPANGNPVYYKADGSLVQGNLSTQTYRVFDPNNPSDISQSATLNFNTDKVILGNTLPTYFGGITNTFRYKNLDLSFLVRFSGGNKIFNSTARELMTQNLNNNSTDILGRWQSVDNPGDGITPRLWASTNTFTNLTGHATSRFLEDGDFISLDNISLGYNLPKSLTDKIRVSNFRFFIQAQNMLIFTKYNGLNPEMETGGVDLNGTPRAKIISMGLNVKL